MGFGQFRTELERATACSISLSEVLLARIAIHEKKRAAVRETRICQRVFRIELDRPPEHLPGVFESAPAPLVNELPPPQVVLVRLHIYGAISLDRLLLTFAEYHAKRVEYCLRDLILNREHIFHVAIEFSR